MDSPSTSSVSFSEYNSEELDQAVVENQDQAPVESPWVPFLRSPKCNLRGRIEIVTVHGIAGAESWTQNRLSSLTDQLQSLISRSAEQDRRIVRVYQTNFEYDPIDFFQTRNGGSNLDYLARSLLGKIASENSWRDMRDGVPMVVLAHDIGGIIAQRVLFSTPANSPDDDGFRRLLINLICETPNENIRARAFGALEEISKACKATADEFCKIAPTLSVLTVWEMGPPDNAGSHTAVFRKQDVVLASANEVILPRRKSHFSMCHFTNEDEQFKTISDFVTELLQAQPLDGHRGLYLSMLRLLSAGSERPFLKSGKQSAGLSEIFGRVTTDSTYKGWLDSRRPAMLYLREPATAKESTAVLCSHICRTEKALNPALVVRYALRENHDYYALASDARRSILRQILMAKPNLMIYLYNTFGSSLDEFMQEQHKQEEGREFALLRTALSCPEASGLTIVIGSFHESIVGASALLSDICEAMVFANVSTRAIVYGSVDISTYIRQPENVHEVNLEDYAVNEDRRIQRIKINNTLDVAIKKTPWLASLRWELEKQISDFEYMSTEDMIFGLKCIQAVHSRSNPSAARREFNERLASSPKLTFDRVTCRLDECSTKWAAKLWMWVVFSPQPLRLEQLAAALSLVGSDKSFNPSEDEFAQDLEADITQYLGSLVTIEDKWVNVAHPAMIQLAKQFVHTVLGHEDADFNPHREIAMMCLKYLSADRLQSFRGRLYQLETYHFHRSEGDGPDDFWKEHGLTLYAVQCWSNHFRMTRNPTDNDVEVVISRFEDNGWLKEYFDVSHQLYRNTFLPTPSVVARKTLSLASHLGLDAVLKVLSKSSAEETDADVLGNCLVAAAASGHIEILQYLIETHHQKTKPSLNSAIAALSRHTPNVAAILQTLLDKLEPIDTSERPEELLEPLSRIGKTDLLKRILQPGRDLRQWRSKIEVAFDAAIYNRNADIVDFILSLDLYRPENDPQTAFSSKMVIYADQYVLDTLVTRPPLIGFCEGRSPLHWAVLAGAEAVVRQLVEDGAVDLNTKDSEGRNPTHYAAAYGYLRMVDIFISKKAEIDLEDQNGETPLFFAVRNQHPEIVRALLVARANPQKLNKRKEGLIRIATLEKSVDAVKVLIENDASLGHVTNESLKSLLLAVQLGSVEIVSCLANEQGFSDGKIDQDEYELTPLLLAASKGYTELCRSLLRSGSSIHEQDNAGLTSLHHAARAGNVDTVDLLLQCGARVEWTTPGTRTALHYAAEEGNVFTSQSLLNAGDSASLRDEMGQTPFDCAVGRGNIYTATAILRGKSVKVPTGSAALAQLLTEGIMQGALDVVELALKSGADVDIRDEGGKSTLLNALTESHISIAKAILKHGFMLDPSSDDTIEALQLAASIDDGAEILKLLHDHGADIHVQDQHGTLLHTAVRNKRLEQVKYLLNHGANVHARGRLEETPLYLAVSSEEIAKVLLENGSDARAHGGRWGTILNAAVCQVWRQSNDGSDIFDMLLSSGAQASDPDAQGITPIHNTALTGDIDLLKFFSEKQASPLRLKDKQGRLPLHFAAARGESKMVQFILDSSAEDDHSMVNTADFDGWTPLHWACRSDVSFKAPVFELLVKWGADPCLLDSLGWKPEHVAIFNGSAAADTMTMLQLKEDTTKPSDSGPDEENTRLLDLQAGESEAQQLQVPVPPEDRWKSPEDNNYNSDDEAEHHPAPIFAGKYPMRSGQINPETCYGCSLDIYGPVYHCRVCDDFDFCFKCSRSRKITHPDHDFDIRNALPELEMIMNPFPGRI
ncbi:hypothetical protein PV04_06308 [Phialophora macrospora]|uniref:ZZ-type domain-containing protein n=1 Tax=Phialophora macrospora TaxID=1851006 RepID=A0A0D2FJY2_9EURO|nr:hypothetical protein PV04_06308 [Phialophora macrospora]